LRQATIRQADSGDAFVTPPPIPAGRHVLTILPASHRRLYPQITPQVTWPIWHKALVNSFLSVQVSNDVMKRQQSAG
ncbi:MAG TPA: hypothetical protein VN229_22070, partial [Terriglobales bacterium]|nr:hypothetical protein [Terriglobales bacterium]